MARERAELDLPDLSEFRPRKDAPAPVNKDEVREAAEAAGFQARHIAPSATTQLAPSFDARSLRRTGRTAKLNIATREETRERFWRLAQLMGLQVGEEVLIKLMDAYECQNATAAGS